MTDSPTLDCPKTAGKLGDLLASLPVTSNWKEIESTAQELANGLRVRGGPVDHHTALGKTLLPQTLTHLLKAALEGSRVPDDDRSGVVLELLRVGANLCMDHNDNRGYLLEAGFPQTTLSLLEAYADIVPAVPQTNPVVFSIKDLKVIKTAIGELLNASLGYEPVQSRLISLEAAVTMLRLTTSIYPVGSWVRPDDTPPPAQSSETWSLRRSITEWSWRAISGLKDSGTQQQLFGPDSLPFLVSPLRAFIPPFSTPPEFISSDSTLLKSLMGTDVDVLEEVCELLESLSLDVEDVRLSLARGIKHPDEHTGQRCLESMLQFVASGNYPPFWNDATAAELTQWKKTMDLCKAAVIRAIVEIAGEEKNIEALWDVVESNSGFVATMVSWLREQSNAAPSETRDDLLICSTLSLANLVRREIHSVKLLKPPIAIGPALASLLGPETDIKVKHGVVGLLKHLAQAPTNRPVLGQAGIIQSLATSQIYGEKADIAEIVQISAIGVAKHMCTNNVENSIALILPRGPCEPSQSGLHQILALVRRSDSVAVKSEGTRVLVNVIKSICSASGDILDPTRQTALQVLTNSDCAMALAQLLGRSTKYPILVNEATVALLLLALRPTGLPLVVDALVAQLPLEVTPSMTIPPSASSPVGTPSTALDVAVIALRNDENRFPAEVRANLCALLAEVGKSVDTERVRERAKIKEETRGPLETIVSSSESMSLSAAARKVLDEWV
ncbi:hypothetical protein BD410DRAFT_782602 [Rickenella mellea]|uniref:ARM repeat-containing protein n=1 Tax=Rickenella mellea TaxID=50990 RepID=A0A4Y7QKS5_9AGAM|nr:hypothetical protein BD410DRAFT_782602 [Rickenella mellea]